MKQAILGGGYTCSVCGQYQRTSAICHHNKLIVNNMKQLPTSEKIISIVDATVAAYSNSPVWYKHDIKKYMIEFAKLHVQAALESALEDAPYGSSTDTVSYKDMKDAILNAYPLDNIK